jgi:hypothetical protein
MNFIKAAAITTLAAASIFGTAPKAEAATCFTVQHTGGQLCNTYRGTNAYGDVYTLGYAIDNVSEGMTVVCRGAQVVDWQSHGNMTQLGAQRLANYFCGI